MRRPSVELCMIVRNGECSLERCLRSAAPLLDRILIGDTGTTDGTASIARRFGAEVVAVPWTDDFAAARNAVLAQARCDWLLVLDADEMLELPQARALLPELLAASVVQGYTLERRDYVAEMHGERRLQRCLPNPGDLAEAAGYPGYVPSFHTRLFRRDPRIRFRGCVHEQVCGQMDELGMQRFAAPLRIHHFGAVETPVAEQETKIRLYHRLGVRKLRDEPDSFEALLQLGVAELSQMNRPERALPCCNGPPGCVPRMGDWRC